MKFWLFVLSVFAVNMVFAQKQFVGTWTGKIAEFDLTLVMHISGEEGKLTASMDSPDQGAKGISCDKVDVVGNNITISVAIIGGSYAGTLSGDGKIIKGKWIQGGSSYDLDLGRDGIPATKPKPQTPQPPFDYRVEEVAYDNTDKTVHLEGTLTFPSGDGRYPVAILISGSGQQDRDETLMGHKPFAIIADRLTRLGFAVLRVDDRGTGKSRGEAAKATSADFAKDVITGIEYLKNRKEIDASRIGLVGHSEGGLIAALVGAERNDIDFMVLLAGPGIPGAELLAEQGEKLLASTPGITAEAVQNYMPFYKKLIDLSAQKLDSGMYATAARAAFHQWKSGSRQELVHQMGFTNITNSEAILENLISGFAAPWMQYFLASNAGILLEKTNAKVLAVNGEKDIQVLPASNTEGIKNALQKSKSPVYEVKILAGLNHLFQRCTSCTVAEYGQLEESFSETALSEITAWLQKNVLKK